VAHRWAYVAGVRSLAAQSPIRGALLLTDQEHVTDQDIADEARISPRDAAAAMAKFRELGMLEADDHGVEWVHDWDQINPDPKPSDLPESTRQRKRAQRERQREGRDVT